MIPAATLSRQCKHDGCIREFTMIDDDCTNSRNLKNQYGKNSFLPPSLGPVTVYGRVSYCYQPNKGQALHTGRHGFNQ